MQFIKFSILTIALMASTLTFGQDLDSYKWIPAYSRVTFSNRPYAEALAMGDAQEEIMQEVMQIPNIEEKWDSKEVEQKILDLI